VHIGEPILIAGALLAVALAASMLASRVRLPGLVFFLAIGMLVGSDGIGLIPLEDFELAQSIGVIALAIILFEGGLAAGLVEVRSVLGASLSLAIGATILTAIVTGLAAGWIFDLTTTEGLLVGAIVAGTDGAAIFGLLRGSTLERRLARTLEGETGLNDPIAVLLVVGLIEVLKAPGFGLPDFLWLFVRELGIGAAVGVAVGWAVTAVLRNTRLESSGLYPVATLAAVAVSFGLAASLHGSGFAACYLAGLVVGSTPIPAERTIASFHDGLAWVAQLSMFLVLGLLVDPGELIHVAPQATALALVLMLIARPLVIFLCTTPLGYSVKENVVLSWAGLRGAVPIVMATFPVTAGVPGAEELFDIVFFVVLLSTVVQGATFESLARRLGLTTDEPALPRPLTEAGTIRRMGAEVLEFPVVEGDAIVGLPVRDLGLPREANVNVIVRDGQAIPPRGSTRIKAGDRLHVLYRQETAREIMALSSSWRRGPIGPQPRPRRPLRGAGSVFVTRPWTEADGDATRPEKVLGREVVALLRLRADKPGSLVLIDDGRYALCGKVLAVGARRPLSRWIEARMRRVDEEERAWLRTALGALVTDPREQPRDAPDR